MSISPTFSKLEIHPKIWGEELWITNNSKYCGKILRFKKGSCFSMHYHIVKEETWLVSKGKLLFDYFDLEKAEKLQKQLVEGDVVHLKPCIPHKLTALEESDVFEVSTQHFNEDSYRIGKAQIE